MVVEYEEVCSRSGIRISACVSVSGKPRTLDRRNVVDLSEIGESLKDLKFIPVAFSPERRRELTELALARGLQLCAPVVDPSATVFSSSRIREGSFVNAGAVIGALSIIGSCCLLNRSVSLGHHVVVQDFVSIGPGATLASNVRVGSNCIIGAGTVVLPNVQIGSGSVISAGSVVRKSVPPGMLVAGNPARALRAHMPRETSDE